MIGDKDVSLKGYVEKQEKSEERNEQISDQPQATNTQFDPMVFMKKITHPERLVDNKETINKGLTANDVWSVCRAVIDEFKKESNLLELPAPITVIGDVHGNYHDLYRVLFARTGTEMAEEAQNSFNARRFARDRFLFLGDYIERGKRSIECICLLFALKIYLPQKYFLLRGAHESVSMNSQEFKNTLEKFSKKHGEKLHRKFNEAFSWMPLAAIVGEKIFCVHGGISPFLKKWKNIKDIRRPLLDLKEDRLAADLVFSDPLDYDIVHVPTSKPSFELNYLREAGVLYNEPAVDEFCKRFKINLIIRSHAWIPFGFRFFAEKKLISIFSSSGYRDERNHGALLKIDDKGKITIITLLPAKLVKKKEKAENAQNVKTENDLAGTSSRALSMKEPSKKGPLM